MTIFVVVKQISNIKTIKMMLNFESVKKILLTVLVMLVAVQVFAQKSTITGVVKDSEGKPIVGATVQEKGLTNSTLTDPEGKFSLQSHNGISIIIKMKGYYTQEIVLENGFKIGDIVLVKKHRWEFGVLAGLSYTPRRFSWCKWGERVDYNALKFNLNVGANIFFHRDKSMARIQTLIGLGFAYFAKQISGNDDYRRSYESYRYTLKQNIQTFDISFLIKHKVRVKRSGICLMYGPTYGVIINDNYKLSFGEDFSESTKEEIKRRCNDDLNHPYALGGVGAIGFEHSSGLGIWGTCTTKWYVRPYDRRHASYFDTAIGGVLSYRF